MGPLLGITGHAALHARLPLGARERAARGRAPRRDRRHRPPRWRWPSGPLRHRQRASAASAFPTASRTRAPPRARLPAGCHPALGPKDHDDASSRFSDWCLHPRLVPAAWWAASDRASAQGQQARPPGGAICRRSRLTPNLQKLLKQIQAARYRASWPCPRKTAGCPAVDGRVEPARSAPSRSVGASGYSAIWIGLGLAGDRRPADRDRVRPGARAKDAADNIARAGPRGHRAGRAGRRVQGDPQAAGDLRLRVPRRVEARLQALPRHGASRAWTEAASSWRTTWSTRAATCPTSSTAIQKNPDLITAIVTPSGEGISISLKTR